MIDVQYRCELCSNDWRVVQVPDRGPDQGVVDWMRRFVTTAIASDHRGRNPRCRAATITEVKIPLPAGEGGRIGDPTKH